VALYKEELAADRVRRQLEDVRRRGEKVLATEAVSQASSLLEDQKRCGELAQQLREYIESLPSQSASHEDLLAIGELRAPPCLTPIIAGSCVWGTRPGWRRWRLNQSLLIAQWTSCSVVY